MSDDMMPLKKRNPLLKADAVLPYPEKWLLSEQEKTAQADQDAEALTFFTKHYQKNENE